MSASSNNTYGPGALSLLGVAFVVLKLCGVIEWPWWLVLTPFWVELAFSAVILLIALAVVVIRECTK